VDLRKPSFPVALRHILIVSIGKMPVFDAIVVSCQCNGIVNMKTNRRVHVATLHCLTAMWFRPNVLSTHAVVSSFCLTMRVNRLIRT